MHSLSQRQEMLKLALLGWFVVVGIGGKHGVDAADRTQPLSMTHERARGVVSASGPHRYSTRRRIGHDADREQPLVFVQRGRLASRTASHNEVDAGFDLPVHKRSQRRLID